MDVLLRQLSRYAFERRHRWWIAGGAFSFMSVLAVTVIIAVQRRPKMTCDPQHLLDAMWSEARRAELVRAFTTSGVPDGKEAWTRAEARIDRYLERWRSAYSQACEATHVLETQSPLALELRHGCLARALQHLDASLDVMAQGDRNTVMQTARILDQIPAPDTCAEPETLEASRPEDPVIRAAVAEIDADLIRASTLMNALQLDAALPLAQDALARAETLGHDSTIANALVLVTELRAEIEPLDEDEMIRAFRLALAAKDDRTAIRAAASMSSSLVFNQAKLHEGLRWAEIAQGLIDRGGGAPEAQLAIDNARAVAWSQLGRRKEAQAIFEAIAEGQRAEPEPTNNLMNILVSLGALHGNEGQLERARAYLEEALEVGIALHGAQDRRLTRIYTNLANIALVEARIQRLCSSKRSSSNAFRMRRSPRRASAESNAM